jgi:hypothetical protein
MSGVQVVFHVGEEVRTMIVDPNGETLMGLFPDSAEYRFVFDGQEISPAFSLGFSGIGEGSHVWLVRRQRRSAKATPKWARRRFWAPPQLINRRLRAAWFRKMFKWVPSEEVMQKFVDEAADPTVARELAKVKDRFMQRVEGSVDCYRKVVLQFVRSTSKDTVQSENSDPMTFSRAEAPSTAELPVLWS